MRVKAPDWNVCVVSASGMFKLKPGQVKNVPGDVASDAVAKGCTLLDEDDAPLNKREEASEEDVLTAVQKIVDEGKAENFTNLGTPRVSAVAAYAKKEVTKQAVMAAWNELTKDDSSS